MQENNQIIFFLPSFSPTSQGHIHDDIIAKKQRKPGHRGLITGAWEQSWVVVSRYPHTHRDSEAGLYHVTLYMRLVTQITKFLSPQTTEHHEVAE